MGYIYVYIYPIGSNVVIICLHLALCQIILTLPSGKPMYSKIKYIQKVIVRDSCVYDFVGPPKALDVLKHPFWLR